MPGRVVAALVGCALIVGAGAQTPTAAGTAFVVPPAARQWQRAIVGDARYYFGLNVDYSVFFAQLHQESRWKATAASKFAVGLAQFTPATAAGMQRGYARDLAEYCADAGGCPLSPRWAIRAQVIYDRDLWRQYPFAPAADERWAFTLTAYNGGSGNVAKERRRCSELSLGRPSPLSSVPRDLRPHSFVDHGRTGAPAMVAQLLNRVGRVLLSEEMIRLAEPTVDSVVLTKRRDLEISRSKVGPVLVDVMNERRAGQGIAEKAVGNEAVNIPRLTVVDRRVAIQQEYALVGGQAERQKYVAQLAGLIVADAGSTAHPTNIADGAQRCNPDRWFAHVELVCLRADWACKESRHYAPVILFRWRPGYRTWLDRA